MSGFSHLQHCEETISAAAPYLQSAASSATSGAGNFELALDDPAASNCSRHSNLPQTLIAQRDDLEIPKDEQPLGSTVSNFIDRTLFLLFALAPSNRPSSFFAISPSN